MIKRPGNRLQATVYSEVQKALKWLFALLWILAVIGSLSPVTLHAAFEDTGTGARPTAMGGTYAAVGDDVQSLMYNPAGLARLRRHEISSEYSRLYTGLSDGSNLGLYYMGYGQPIKYGGTVAFGWKQFNLDELYSERTLSLGYGEWITERVAAGFALKQLHHSFGAPSISVDDNGNVTNASPTFFTQYGNASTAYSFDLGVLVRWTNRHTFGLSIQDVNEPDIALNPNDHEIVPRTLRMALAYKGRRGFTLAGGMTTRESLSNQRDVTWTGAAEKWWTMKDKTQVGARGSLATGSRSFQQMATGAGYRFGSYQVDYAFVFNLSGITLGDTAGTHRFSLSYRFGPEAPVHIRSIGSARKPSIKKAKRPAVETVRERETTPKSPEPKPVAGEKIKRPARAAEPVSLEEIGMEREITESAQMMGGKIPLTTPASVKPAVPAIPVQVPAPFPPEADDEAPVQAEDMEVSVQNTPTLPEVVEPINREGLLVSVESMGKDFTRRIAARSSAEDRLSAFAPLYPALKGYHLGISELMDQMETTGPVDQSEQVYEALKWNGASAQDKLQHLTQALETTLVPALRNRQWNMADQRDKRYKAWLEQAIAKGRQLGTAGVSAPARMTYWSQVAGKALEFERQAPESTPAPAKPAPQEAPRTVPLDAPEQGVGRPLGDGEWLYKVREGDTLLSLANRFYGDYKRWRDIYILNEDRLGRGGTLRPGQLLLMPKSATKSLADPPRRSGGKGK